MTTDPDYPQYESIDDFIVKAFNYAKVKEPFDCDGYMPHELLVISIQKTEAERRHDPRQDAECEAEH